MPCEPDQAKRRWAWAAAARMFVPAMNTVATRTIRVSLAARSAVSASNPGDSTATTCRAATNMRAEPATKIKIVAVNTVCTTRRVLAVAPASTDRDTVGMSAFATAPAINPSTRFITP